MPSKSKTKGNKFENDIVKTFNAIHETEEFRRTPNSGAMMGRSNASKFAGLSEDVKRTLSSDIITPDWYPFAIECKHYGDKPNYSTIIKGNDSTLDHWLGEALFDAQQQDLWPMLCFKTDRKGAHVVIPKIWMELTNWSPSFHCVYHDIFVIVGLDEWCHAACNLLMNTQTDITIAVMDTHRDLFFTQPQIDYFIKVIEKG